MSGIGGLAMDDGGEGLGGRFAGVERLAGEGAERREDLIGSEAGASGEWHAGAVL